MKTTPLPLSFAAARALKLPPGRRSAEVFVDGDLEIRFAAPPGTGPQVPHERDEFYIVVAGTGRYWAEDREPAAVGPGDLLFAAARVEHGFENISPDFAVWIGFYGPQK